MADLDNIGKRILHVLKENKQKPTPFEERKEISRGYLKRAADSGTGIGTEIVEKILLEFPEVDAYWLITGKVLSRNTEESQQNIQPQQMNAAADKSGEVDVKKLMDSLSALTQANLLANQSIADLLRGGKVVEHGQEQTPVTQNALTPQ